MDLVAQSSSDDDEYPIIVKPNLEKIRSIAHPDSRKLLYGRHVGPRTRGIIYVGVCLDTDKLYVGRLRHAKDGRSWEKGRLDVHKRSSGCWLIHHALKKHTIEWYVLEELPVEALNDRERHWIAELKSQHPNGYNLDSGGSGGADCWSEATKQKRKETMATPESRAKRSKLAAGQWENGAIRRVIADAAEKRLVATLEEANRLAVPDVPNKQRVHRAYYWIGSKIYRFVRNGKSRGQLYEMSREAIEEQRRVKRLDTAARDARKRGSI